ncbi:MAG: short-chain dehydrogenase, partial [Proteobacteria bacterium]
MRANQVKFHSFNLDALSAEGRGSVLSELGGLMQGGKVRMLLHSIALGSVKVMAPVREEGAAPAEGLAKRLQMPPSELQSAIDQEFETDSPALSALATKPAYDSELLLGDEEMAETIFAMGTSLLTWTRDLFKRGLFAEDARVVGLTSEGNEVAWHGYAAVSAAKAALEAVSRSIAREFAPYGIRSNIVQPGVTDTPALRLIPGNKHLAAKAKL